MRDTLTSILFTVATRGPIAWAASWNARVNAAFMRDIFELDPPMQLRDVLPWAPKPTAEEIESSSTPWPCHPESHPSLDQPAGLESPLGPYADPASVNPAMPSAIPDAPSAPKK